MTHGSDIEERPARMGEPFIAVRSLSKAFGKHPALALPPENEGNSKERHHGNHQPKR